MTDFNKITEQFVQTIVDGISVKLQQAIRGAFGQSPVAEAPVAAPKRGPGRPAGSKNKQAKAVKPAKVEKKAAKAKKKSSAKKVKADAPKRGPGRPPGSKNKKKPAPVEASQTAPKEMGTVEDINFFGDKSE